MAAPGSVTVECGAGMLLVSWRGLTRAEHDRAVTALRTISGAVYDAEGKLWRVPVRQADRLYEALPGASYSYDAICAVVDAADGRIDRFMRNLRALGVRFAMQDDQVIAYGAHVSPLVQRLVSERSVAAAAWLRDNPERADTQPAEPAAPVTNAETWRQAELLGAALHNAAQKQIIKNAMRQRGGKHYA